MLYSIGSGVGGCLFREKVHLVRLVSSTLPAERESE
jgi:hypothetical protein